MGYEENASYNLFKEKYPNERLTMAEIWAAEDRERKIEEQKQIENAKADAKAVWALADYYLPADVKEMADRWKMGSTLQEMWRGAFIEGWRAAHRK
jgi:Ni/Co efflux regulator RcnB